MTPDDPRSVHSLDYPGPPLPILMRQRRLDEHRRGLGWLVLVCLGLALVGAWGLWP